MQLWCSNRKFLIFSWLIWFINWIYYLFWRRSSIIWVSGYGNLVALHNRDFFMWWIPLTGKFPNTISGYSFYILYHWQFERLHFYVKVVCHTTSINEAQKQSSKVALCGYHKCILPGLLHVPCHRYSSLHYVTILLARKTRNVLLQSGPDYLIWGSV